MYKLIKSPKYDKKYRIMKNGKSIDFGAKGYSDYTIHKNPFRMRLYVGRHGGKISQSIKDDKNKETVHKKMLKVTRSTKENWTKSGLMTAGFWSRWLLWSEPDIEKAKKQIKSRFQIYIV